MIPQNPQRLKFLQITHILTVAVEIDLSEQLTPLNIKYKRINADDYDSFPLSDYFDEMNEFIHDCLLNKGKIIVHCALGVSRSPAAIMAYLIKYKGLTMEEAFKTIKSKREFINPNKGFLDQLKEYARSISQNNEENKNKKETKIIFRCKTCRFELFKKKEIIHGTQEKKCTSFFLENSLFENLNENECKLYCFNEKCGQKIGEMRLSGGKCSCGEWFTPSYQIHKNKIDSLEVCEK